MSGQRERIRMTDAEVAEFLAAERTLQVASIGPDGVPHLVPMWFGLVGGRIAMWTYAKSQKAANLRRDPGSAASSRPETPTASSGACRSWGGPSSATTTTRSTRSARRSTAATRAT